ncbi:MAG: hypothetical protein ABEK02_05845 [Haloquadratum sp.]
MGIRRGTVLGLTGVAGALLEQQFGLVARVAGSALGVGAVPTAIGWILGCFVGVVAGDVVTAITGQDVNLGRWAGIKKGLFASTVAGLGLLVSGTGLADTLLAGPLDAIPLAPADAVKIGSIWLGTVLGDFFDA